MERVGEHPVPVGPLAVRWLAYGLDEQRAGVETRARLRLENAGTAAWRSHPGTDIHLSYHWLDAAGYADSEGGGTQDAVRQWAFKYRDYVIRAFNEDLPYDRFVVEHVAGKALVRFEIPTATSD